MLNHTQTHGECGQQQQLSALAREVPGACSQRCSGRLVHGRAGSPAQAQQAQHVGAGRVQGASAAQGAAPAATSTVAQ